MSDSTPCRGVVAIILAHRRTVCFSLLRKGLSKADAEDVTQLVLLKALDAVKAGRFVIEEGADPEEHVPPWLRGFAWRAAVAWRRQAHMRHECPLFDADEEVPGLWGPDPVRRFEAREELCATGRDLTDDERALLDAIGQEANVHEAAALLGLRPGTAWTRLRKVRARLLRRRRWALNEKK